MVRLTASTSAWVAWSRWASRIAASTMSAASSYGRRPARAHRAERVDLLLAENPHASLERGARHRARPGPTPGNKNLIVSHQPASSHGEHHWPSTLAAPTDIPTELLRTHTPTLRAGARAERPARTPRISPARDRFRRRTPARGRHAVSAFCDSLPSGGTVNALPDPVTSIGPASRRRAGRPTAGMAEPAAQPGHHPSAPVTGKSRPWLAADDGRSWCRRTNYVS